MTTECVACSVFRREIEALRSKGILQLKTHYVDARLHHDPFQMAKNVERLVRHCTGLGRETVMVMGKCHERLELLEREERVARTAGETCVEILLGDEFHELRDQGGLPLLPDWLVTWREALIAENGLATHLPGLRDHLPVRVLVYVHTGLVPVPHEQLNELSLHTHLPYEVRETPLHCLYARIPDAMEGAQAST